MPRTKYPDIKSRDALLDEYEKQFHQADIDQINDWLNSFGSTKNNAALKRRYMLDYLSKDVTDEQFAQFEERLKDDPVTQNLIDRMVNELTFHEIYDQRDAFALALFGKELGLEDDTYLEHLDNAIKICDDHSEEREYRQQRVKTVSKEKNRFEKQIIAQCEENLAGTVYDETKKDDPLPEDEQIREVGLAARILSLHYMRTEKCVEFPDTDSLGYSYNTFCKEFDKRDTIARQKEAELEASKDFEEFIKEQRASGNKDAFKTENLANAWKAYQMKLGEAREEYEQFKTVIDKPVDLIPEKMKIQPFMLFSVEHVDDYTKEDLQAECKEIVEKNRTGDRLSAADFMKAANLIVADTLLSPAADKTFYDDKKIKTGNHIDQKKLCKAVTEMRDQVIHDPTFRKVLADRPKSKDIAALYKDAVTKEINKRIRNEKAEKAAMAGNEQVKREHEQFAENTQMKLTKEEVAEISETLHKLTKLNEGKDPSDHMKRLVDALIKVNMNMKEEPKVKDLEELNKAALNYYNKRQGLLFSPLTDDGRARLAVVGKLTDLTGKLVQRCKEKEISVKNEAQKQVNKNNAVAK